MSPLRRRWVLAPVVDPLVTPGSRSEPDPPATPAREPESERAGADTIAVRPTTPADDALLVALLDAAYVGTIDADPDSDHDEELRTWRNVDGANDRASAVALVDGELVGACLIGAELGAPFLYEIVVAPHARRTGIGARLLATSIAVLSSETPDHLAAWVTHGNTASERLLAGAGFRAVTGPLDQPRALVVYRAARLLESLGVPAGRPVAIQLDVDPPILWILGEAGADRRHEVAGVEITVRSVAGDDPRVPQLAAAVPLRGAAALLDPR